MSKQYLLFLSVCIAFIFLFQLVTLSAQESNINQQKKKSVTAATLLGNPKYLAMSYGGYRENSRKIEPSIAQLQEDLKIMAAMGVKVIRTYNTQEFTQTANLLEAIRLLKKKDATFEMYLMIGAWIDCQGAWTNTMNHEFGDEKKNKLEIDAAVVFAKKYPDIVKIIAVGNESMVHWASSYYVSPKVVLHWVNYLQDLKVKGLLPKSLWITSSDNFASWGGGDDSYKTKDLEALIRAVDYVSLHTYPFHDTFYNDSFWGVPVSEMNLNDLEKSNAAMQRALNSAISQYNSTADYIKSLGVNKPIHIGETGWATIDNVHFDQKGTAAADEYKSKLYFDLMRAWSTKNGISCFYFQAFDEPWKDATNVNGSENHFGLIDIHGKAKYALWEMVDKGAFKNLERNGKPITKSFDGDQQALLKTVFSPQLAKK
jgi:exo-beta-1,3-glucanase (GH17 family)